MSDAEPAPEQLAPFLIELARSSRSKCKVCRKAIDKGAARIGVLLEGPFGTGYLWHHIPCLARRDFAKVEEAYAGDYTAAGVERPPLDELRGLHDEAAKKKAEKQDAPFVERAATGRSKCAQCGEPVEQGTFRVALLRKVEFYGQVRHTQVKVHPRCVRGAVRSEESGTSADDFAARLAANSRIAPAEVQAALREIGAL